MKRKGKCVGKVAFSSWFSAQDVARKHYLSNRRILSIYECPKCLDYHLTSKAKTCNLAHLHDQWVINEVNTKEKRKKEATRINEENRAKNISRDIIRKEYEEFYTLFRMTCYRLGVSVGIKKPPTVLKGVLPRAERLKILSEMRSRQNEFSTP